MEIQVMGVAQKETWENNQREEENCINAKH